jgi:uncharacterized membrane protein
MSVSTKFVIQAGVISALYATVTIILAPLSYGPVQIRVSEALTVLPFVTPAAVPGLFLGCVIGNVYGGLGLYDIIGGSFCTLLAAYFTYLLSRTKRPILAPLPPVLINAFGVSLYLHFLFNLPYLLTVLYIAVGETLVCYSLGYALLKFVLREEGILRSLEL